MSQVSYIITTNRGFYILGFTVGVFLQLAIVYQLFSFYAANTLQYLLVVYGIPLAAAFFQGILIVNFAGTLSERNQSRVVSLRQFSISALTIALIFYGMYLVLIPGILRLIEQFDDLSFVFRVGLFEMIALCSSFLLIWINTRRS